MISIRKRILSLANMLLEFIVGIGLTVFITRFYSIEEAGQWFIFIAIFALASSLRDALVQAALIKGTAHAEDSMNLTHLKTNGTIVLSAELLMCGVLLVSSFIVSGDWSKLLLFYPIYSIPNAIMRWLIFYLRGKLTLAPILAANAINSSIIFVGIALVIQWNLPLSYVVVVLGISSLAAALHLLPFIPLKQMMSSTLSKEQLLLIKRVGFLAAGREATSAVSSRISLFITGSLLTLQHTALLGVSQRFAQVALLPNNSFQSILFPSLVQCVQNGNREQARKQFHESISLLLSITIPMSIVGMALSPYVLTLLNGVAYQHAWVYLSIYVFIATCITPFGAAFGSAVTAWGKPQLAFRLVLINSILTIVLSFVLIKFLGVFGAPLAMVIVELSGLVCVAYLLKKVCGIHIQETLQLIPGHYGHVILRLKQQLVLSLHPISKK
ncbi:MAG: polysaccharide biosynthesis C-terminal domain-containing protein [Bacteroidetes bacterium]|nr:polysaccharide biosynthesis C-terminal domain-containing protein [Bacteroidota bacterium]